MNRVSHWGCRRLGCGLLGCLFFGSLFLGILLSGCHRDNELTILSYNVQNLFDDIEDGNEYKDFLHSAGYSPDRYFRRLTLLADTLRAVSPVTPELVVLQEIEGPRVTADLLKDHLRSPRYTATIVPTQGQMGIAILSRRAPQSVRSHQAVEVALIPRAASESAVHGDGFHMIHRSRLVVEVDVESTIGHLTLFACHWKSQSGGEEETEPLRLREAALLRGRISDIDAAELNPETVLAIGDFNEDVEEYQQHRGSYRTALMPSALVGSDDGRSIYVTSDPSMATLGGPVTLFSPWLAASSDTPPGVGGSYYHAGTWERLDQVLCGPIGERICTISVAGLEMLFDADGRPARYDPRSGIGLSDHLPVRITIGSTRQSR